VVIRDVIKLFHPAIPYLTEELWANVVGDGFVAGANWPEVPPYEGPEAMEDLQALISGVRRFRAEQGISPRQDLVLRVHGGGGLEPWSARLLGDLGAVTVESIASPPTGGHTRIVAGRYQGFIPLEGVIDTDAERERLTKRRDAAQEDLDRVEKKLGNGSFVDRAPAEIVEKERGKQRELSDLVKKIQAQLDLL
jgi:valyl-tRNA synthetase